MTDQAEKTRKLAALQNYGTRYEIEIVRPGGDKRLVAYAGRKSARGLMDAVYGKREAVLAFLGAERDTRFMSSPRAMLFEGGGVAKFSGRTQRDAINEGELISI